MAVTSLSKGPIRRIPRAIKRLSLSQSRKTSSTTCWMTMRDKKKGATVEDAVSLYLKEISRTPLLTAEEEQTWRPRSNGAAMPAAELQRTRVPDQHAALWKRSRQEKRHGRRSSSPTFGSWSALPSTTPGAGSLF